MLPEVARAMRKIEGSITFDLDTWSEKKLYFHLEGTCSHLVSKFEEHLLKNDFIRTYPTQHYPRTFNGQLVL